MVEVHGAVPITLARVYNNRGIVTFDRYGSPVSWSTKQRGDVGSLYPEKQC